MCQNSGESDAVFAHHFLEMQHALEKLFPGIQVSPNGSQLDSVLRSNGSSTVTGLGNLQETSIAPPHAVFTPVVEN